jgi:hypothetical protein
MILALPRAEINALDDLANAVRANGHDPTPDDHMDSTDG